MEITTTATPSTPCVQHAHAVLNGLSDREPDTVGGTSTIEREETRQVEEPGDHERFSHYVRKEKIMESALSGDPVIALCGKVWTPGRDPERFPVCPTCKEIYQGLRPGKDNPDDQ